MSHALAEASDVLPAAQSLHDEIWREQHHAKRHQHAVQEIHGWERGAFHKTAASRKRRIIVATRFRTPQRFRLALHLWSSDDAKHSNSGDAEPAYACLVGATLGFFQIARERYTSELRGCRGRLFQRVAVETEIRQSGSLQGGNSGR